MTAQIEQIVPQHKKKPAAKNRRMPYFESVLYELPTKNKEVPKETT